MQHFEDLIQRNSSRRALFLHGLGGVGKTSLLDACEERAIALGLPVRRLDLRDYAQPAALDQALAEAAPPTPVWVLLLDTCERLGAAQDALFRRWLPNLPDSVRIVLAGRKPPSLEWRADPGWCEAMQVCEVANLVNLDARELLARLGVPEARHENALSFTRGHPLALVLVAQIGGDSEQTGAGDPQVIALLLKRFLADIPDSAHRQAVEVSCYARVTHEAVLRLFFEAEQAHALYHWLAALPFMEQGRDGLFPHDLVRTVVDADLRSRDPQRYEYQHRRIGRWYIERAAAGGVYDLLYMHRNTPLMGSMLDWNSVGDIHGVPAQAEDAGLLRDCVTRHEGADSALLCAAWFEKCAEAFVVFRDSAQNFRGFMAYLYLDSSQLAQPPARADPACLGLVNLLGKTPALKTRERVGLVRWWISDAAYHQPGPVHSAMIARLTELWLSGRDVALDLLPHSRPEFWKSQMKYVGLELMPDADFAIDERRYTVYGHDWRIANLVDWLDSFEVRRAKLPQFKAMIPAAPPPTREEFDAWLRQALRDAQRSDRLATNPLCRQPVFSGCTDPAAALREWLLQGIADLKTDGKAQRLAPVIETTYFRGCPNQEVAAERLNLAFGTYRHRLRAAEALLADALWPQVRTTSRSI